MSSFEWVSLGTVCDFENGDRGENYPSKSEFQKQGIPFLNAGNIADGSLTVADFDCITQEKYDSLRAGKVRYGDILFCLRGAIGKCAVSTLDKAAIASSLVIIRNKPCIDARYLYYVLTSAYFQKCMSNCDNGSVQGNMSVAFLKTINRPLPSFAAQEIIARVLGAIDDKIALNKKMMTELEDTARLIYDYWFTQFDFPDENGRPYCSSGGKMVYNKTLKREIPEGWEAGTLSNLAAYGERSIGNSLLTTNTYVSTDNMLPNRGGVLESQYLSDAGSSNMFERRDILLSNIRPYFKKIWLADRVGGCCNDVLVLHPTNIDDWAYLYWTVESDIFFAYDTAGAKGSKMPRGDKDHIMRYPFALPPIQLRTSFAEQVSSLMTAEEKLQAESAQLSSLRDWMLPMLDV